MRLSAAANNNISGRKIPMKKSTLQQHKGGATTISLSFNEVRSLWITRVSIRAVMDKAFNLKTMEEVVGIGCRTPSIRFCQLPH